MTGKVLFSMHISSPDPSSSLMCTSLGGWDHHQYRQRDWVFKSDNICSASSKFFGLQHKLTCTIGTCNAFTGFWYL